MAYLYVDNVTFFSTDAADGTSAVHRERDGRLRDLAYYMDESLLDPALFLGGVYNKVEFHLQLGNSLGAFQRGYPSRSEFFPLGSDS